MRYHKGDERISQMPSRIDWLMRYEPILNFILKNDTIKSILDFGCGPVGLGSVYARQYYGIDLLPILPLTNNLIPINGIHPFQLQQRFDFVCAMDVLEHIPLCQRAMFWTTLKRITKQWAIVSIPTNHLFDLEYLSLCTTEKQGQIPQWLLEHLSQPMPDDDSVLESITKNNFKIIKRIPQLTRIEYYIGMLDAPVGGDWKIRMLNDIHAINQANCERKEPERYRTIWILEAS